MNDLPPKPRREVVEALGHILLSVGPSGCFFRVPDLVKPRGNYTPDPVALVEAMQHLSDNGLAERYGCDGVTLIRFTMKGVALAKEALRIHKEVREGA